MWPSVLGPGEHAGGGSQKKRQWFGGVQRAVLFPFQASLLQLALKKDGEFNYWMASPVLHLPLAPFG